MQKYRFKFYLNAVHSIEISGLMGKEHPHTWEIVLDTLKNDDSFTLFTAIEKGIESTIAKYQDKNLNLISPFDSINPTLENVTKYLKQLFEHYLIDKGWFLTKIEVSETPTRSFVIDNSSTGSYLGGKPEEETRDWNFDLQNEVGKFVRKQHHYKNQTFEKKVDNASHISEIKKIVNVDELAQEVTPLHHKTFISGFKLKRSLFGGYRKKEVLETISNLTKKARLTEELYSKEITVLKNQNSSLVKKIHSLVNDICQLKNEIAAIKRGNEIEKQELISSKEQLARELEELKYMLVNVGELDKVGADSPKAEVVECVQLSTHNPAQTCDVINANDNSASAKRIEEANESSNDSNNKVVYLNNKIKKV